MSNVQHNKNANRNAKSEPADLDDRVQFVVDHISPSDL